MKKKKERKKIEILKVVSMTPGGNRAWVETNVGLVRKPLNAIPKELLDEFNKNAGGA